jgi:cell division septation protein DedD
MEQTGKARVLVEPVGFAQNPQPITSNSYSRYENPDSYDQGLTPRNPYAATVPSTTNPYPLNRTALLPKISTAAPSTETVVQSPYNTYPSNPLYTPGNRTDYQTAPAPNTYPPASDPVSYDYPANAAPADMAARSPFATNTRTSGFGIQLGAYGSKENAERQAQSIQVLGVGEVFVVPGISSQSAVVYRVIAGASGTRAEAEAYRRQLMAQFRLSGFIVEF